MRTFAELFKGRTDCHGKYHLHERGETLPGEKRKGHGTTHREPITPDLWEQHINATGPGLGIVPVCLDKTVNFFVLDVDHYGVDDMHSKLAAKIAKLGLPLVVTRSKSGGAHLWCFLKHPMPAADAIKTMKDWKVRLGFAATDKRVELFPKQEHVQTLDVGNWINLPYYGNGSVDGRFGVNRAGQRLALEDFLKLATAQSIDPADIGMLSVVPDENQDEPDTTDDEALADAPPCVRHMLTRGIEEGGRNNALAQIGIYLQRKYPDDWSDRLAQINREHAQPPLPPREMSNVIGSLTRKQYQYLCTHFESICDKAACMKAAFGVGSGGQGQMGCIIRRLKHIKTEPSIWVADVEGEEVQLSTKQLRSPGMFAEAVTEQLSRVIPVPKAKEWFEMIGPLVSSAEIIVPPPEAKIEEQVREVFREWCVRRIPSAKSFDRLKDGSPCWDDEVSAVVFRTMDLMRELEIAKIKVPQEKVWKALQDWGVKLGERVRTTGGEQIRVCLWVVEPWFDLPNKEGAF